MSLDKVHPLGMSENGSIFMTVNLVTDEENKVVRLEPPVEVVFEGNGTNVAITQGALAARYSDEELAQIGEGSPAQGIKRVIGDIAMNGNLVHDATKPLHPTQFDIQQMITLPELPEMLRVNTLKLRA